MTIYDKFNEIADKVMRADRLFDIRELIDDNDIEISAMPKSRIDAELRGRGLIVANGIVRPPTARQWQEAIKPDYSSFVDAAVRIVKEQDRPVKTADLITMTGLGSEFIPMASMSNYLKREGIHYIVGLGYWKLPQFTDPSGFVMGKKSKEKHFDLVTSIFEQHGWPLSGKDFETITEGQITSLYMSKYACRGYATAAIGIGNSLFVPTGVDPNYPVPMSRNIAQKILNMRINDPLESPDHFTLHKIFTLLEREGMAVVKRSATSRGGVRIRTFKASLTDLGFIELRKIVGNSQDEF